VPAEPRLGRVSASHRAPRHREQKTDQARDVLQSQRFAQVEHIRPGRELGPGGVDVTVLPRWARDL
jgi:hypothetical protein